MEWPSSPDAWTCWSTTRAWRFPVRLTRRALRVNAVHPGTTLSHPILREVPAERTSLREPAEVAAVIAFLAGPNAAFLDGVHIPVDGGLTAPNGHADTRPVDVSFNWQD